MMTNEEFIRKLFAGGNSYWLTRFIILRFAGFVYAVANFWSPRNNSSAYWDTD